MEGVGALTPAAITTVLANVVAVAVAFGAPLTHSQQDILLVFAGSVTTLVFMILAAVHAHHVSSSVKLALGQTGPSGSPIAPPTSSEVGG